MSQTPTAPVTLEVEYPESLSRALVLLKFFLGWIYVSIPHGIILLFYGLLVWVTGIVAFFAILFTGRYPRGLFDLIVGYFRWNARVETYVSYLMSDSYPPFSPDEKPGDPVRLNVEYPERLSRVLVLFKFFFGWIYVGIPHGIILLLYGLVVWICSIIAFFAILFTGRYPRGIFDLIMRYRRWGMRVNVYLSYMRDEYPPFHGRP